MERHAVVVVDGDADGQPGDLPQDRIEVAAADRAAQARSNAASRTGEPALTPARLGMKPISAASSSSIGLRAGRGGVGCVDRQVHDATVQHADAAGDSPPEDAERGGDHGAALSERVFE